MHCNILYQQLCTFVLFSLSSFLRGGENQGNQLKLVMTTMAVSLAPFIRNYIRNGQNNWQFCFGEFFSPSLPTKKSLREKTGLKLTWVLRETSLPISVPPVPLY